MKKILFITALLLGCGSSGHKWSDSFVGSFRGSCAGLGGTPKQCECVLNALRDQYSEEEMASILVTSGAQTIVKETAGHCVE